MIGAPVTVSCSSNQKIQVRTLSGHFAMTHAHTNTYVDILDVKLNQKMACDAAQVLAKDYAYEQQIDTIVCMDGMEVIGAFLARALTKDDLYSVNENPSLYVVTPELEHARQMLFRDNLVPMIRDKKVLVLCGSVITGSNARKAMECVSWYGGEVVGIAAVFSILDKVDGTPAQFLFGKDDIPGYEAVDNASCPLCKAGERVDALANCYGYSRL